MFVTLVNKRDLHSRFKIKAKEARDAREELFTFYSSALPRSESAVLAGCVACRLRASEWLNVRLNRPETPSLLLQVNVK